MTLNMCFLIFIFCFILFQLYFNQQKQFLIVVVNSNNTVVHRLLYWHSLILSIVIFIFFNLINCYFQDELPHSSVLPLFVLSLISLML